MARARGLGSIQLHGVAGDHSRAMALAVTIALARLQLVFALAIATGGAGGDASAIGYAFGAGGGGGGGIVHFIAPVVTNDGQVHVEGGGAGQTYNTVTGHTNTQPRAYTGAGGGSCGGRGGDGQNLGFGATPPATVDASTAAGAGSIGYAIVSEIDPTTLF